MRVTEGLGPTSLRDSSFVNNTATAVLRFEGRTWVLKTDTFFAGIQFLDVLFYTQFQGASEAAYKFAELQHAQQQVRVLLGLKGSNHSLQRKHLCCNPAASWVDTVRSARDDLWHRCWHTM